MRRVGSWGRLGRYTHDVIDLNDRCAISAKLSGKLPGIAHGMGRSYGDVCLNPGGVLWRTTGLDRFIRFDNATGRLLCEAGVLLRDIHRLFLPRGWMLPVSPGTQMVTVGGAIANDVHGKNHHVRGSFGDHVKWMRLVRTNGETIECSPQSRQDWFSATVGGLGLTGVIAEAEIQLCRVHGAWVDTETIPFNGLDKFFHLADSSETQWEHTVSWIDCMSADCLGLFMRGNPSRITDSRQPKSKAITVPFTPPVSLVNRATLRPFNALYFNLKKRRAGGRIEHFESFFYPLDNLLEWNKMYGAGGFYQYQSVVPRTVGLDAVKAMLREIKHAGEGSFLAVLKTFGNREAVGMMSFPQPGVTLALDFPNRGLQTLRLFERLDDIVRNAHGRIYPAKDARMPRDLFEAGYPLLKNFLKYRDSGISSGLSRRLMGG